ncbi:hypothetical protein MKP07_08910 [Niabella hibiscisoli]|nr:hypothetical protein [Niabella hibiscisoli]
MIQRVFILLLAGTSILSCNSESKSKDSSTDSITANTTMKEPARGSFGYDVNFLQQKDSNLIVLKSEDGQSQVIISPKYQAKVFTSSADGANGKSFGWVNYKAFDGPVDAHMNAYGEKTVYGWARKVAYFLYTLNRVPKWNSRIGKLRMLLIQRAGRWSLKMEPQLP